VLRGKTLRSYGKKEDDFHGLCAVAGGVEECGFHASKGWSENVKKWVSLHNVKKVGNHAGGTKYPEHIKMTIHKDY
jgi:hypothetical protein